MNNKTKRWLGVLGCAVAAGAALWGCAAAPPAPVAAPAEPTAVPARPADAASAPGPAAASTRGAGVPWRYRCDRGGDFTVRFADDTAFIDSARDGREVVLRDAGGVTPQQSVYSNARLRIEFGLGAGGREAMVRYLPEPQAAHCVLQ